MFDTPEFECIVQFAWERDIFSLFNIDSHPTPKKLWTHIVDWSYVISLLNKNKTVSTIFWSQADSILNILVALNKDDAKIKT